MFQTLEKQVGDRLILPNHENFDEARKVWNSAIDRKPGVIVRCETEEDVKAGVVFAHENNLTVSVKAGGHHLGGLAVGDDSVLIDLSNMKKVTVDPEKKVAYVQGGATLKDVDNETQKYGLATPTGTVSETGIAGLTLNGGLGYLRGKYGLTCDNLVGASVVTASGELIEVNETSHPDLFWALRGGGGNFGVVTEFVYQLHEVGPEVLALDVMYDYKDAKDVIKKAQAYMNDAPDEVSINLTMTTLPPAPFIPDFLHMKKVIMLTGMFAGTPSIGEEVIKPLRELGEPIVDGTGIMPYAQLQSKLDVMVPEHVPVHGTSLYFKGLTDEVIDTLLTKIDHAPAPSILVQLWSLHGKMNRVASNATPYAIRDANFVLLTDIMAMDVELDLCKQWVDSVYGSLLPSSHHEASYLNGITPSEKVVKAAFRGNYERLMNVKNMYDPKNVFCHNHNVVPGEK